MTPTPTPSPTPTRTLTAKEQAQADAIAAVRKYYAVTYALKRKPPSTRLIAAGVSRVALGNEYYSSVDLILSYKKNGWHLTGSSALDAPKFTETILLFRGGGSQRRPPTIALSVCLDISNVDVINRDGGSVVSPDRKDRALQHIELLNPSYPQGTGWRVSKLGNNTKSC